MSKTFKTHNRWLGGVWASLAMVSLCGFDRGCATSPRTDTLVTSSAVAVEGTLGEYTASGSFQNLVEGYVRLNVNGSNLAWVATNSSKIWSYSSVGLNPGVNVLKGTTYRTVAGSAVWGNVLPYILEYKNDLPNRGQQKVFLNWYDANADTHLKAIASHTLNGPLSAADLNAFVAGVKSKIAEYVSARYAGTQITLVNASGVDVHTVNLNGSNTCSLYGQSPGDYKNLNKQQTSTIYIGTFKCVIVDYNEMLSSTAAKKTDAMDVRITDVATMIGRTVAHEVGHSLGLTAEGSQLHGCEGMHNCEAYDEANPSDRFDHGHYIMDPGPKSTVYARMGLANGSSVRKKQTPVFDAYGKSYLKIIHP
jgi:hypothetical protein